MDPAAHLRKFAQAGDRRHFPVAEVPGEHEDALAALERAREYGNVVDLDARGFLTLAHRARAQEFGKQTPQVRVMRLREPLDLRVGHARAEDASQVFEDHATAKGQQAIDEPPRKRGLRELRERQGDR